LVQVVWEKTVVQAETALQAEKEVAKMIRQEEE
jgi:predicted GIY-YIG superfamily endonuclease